MKFCVFLYSCNDVHSERVRMRQKPAVAYFTVLPVYFPGGTEERHEITVNTGTSLRRSRSAGQYMRRSACYIQLSFPSALSCSRLSLSVVIIGRDVFPFCFPRVNKRRTDGRTDGSVGKVITKTHRYKRDANSNFSCEITPSSLDGTNQSRSDRDFADILRSFTYIV